MSPRRRRTWHAALLASCLLASASQGRAESHFDRIAELDRASDMIDELDLDQAERILAKLDADDPGSPAVTWERAQLAFYRGDYGEASTLGKQAIDAAPNDRATKPWRSLQELMQATEQVTREYRTARSEDGRYIVEYPDDRDRVLVPYALDVLRAMDQTLTRVMGRPLPGPIRLEVYASSEALSKVSTLTVEQIQTSGTVALCKWNRLMITSPRALVRGYPWVDTIAHELTHLYLSYITKDKAPVWVQEGTAKLLERRWRDDKAPYVLEPASRALLEKATRDNKLLTFDQLHPSIALLPSQDDAALAFAQVSTFMDEYVKVHGEDALRDAYAKIAAGTDARDALAGAAHTKFGELEKTWRSKLPKAAVTMAPRKLARRFRSSKGDAPDETEEVTQSEAKRFLRIGDLLWNQHRVLGAMLEYDKAHHSDSDDPIVAARLAQAALEAGDPARSLAAVDPLVTRYPEHAPTQAMRGAALAALGRSAEAHDALIEAVRINPFDPEPHCTLAKLPETGKAIGAEREACTALGGAQKSR